MFTVSQVKKKKNELGVSIYEVTMVFKFLTPFSQCPHFLKLCVIKCSLLFDHSPLKNHINLMTHNCHWTVKIGKFEIQFQMIDSKIWDLNWFDNDYLSWIKDAEIGSRKIAYTKGQLNSEWIYEVIVPPKMPTKNFSDFYRGS